MLYNEEMREYNLNTLVNSGFQSFKIHYSNGRSALVHNSLYKDVKSSR